MPALVGPATRAACPTFIIKPSATESKIPKKVGGHLSMGAIQGLFIHLATSIRVPMGPTPFLCKVLFCFQSTYHNTSIKRHDDPWLWHTATILCDVVLVEVFHEADGQVEYILPNQLVTDCDFMP